MHLYDPHLYDQLIGRWEAEAQAFLLDGSPRRLRGEEIFQEGKGSDGALLRWIFSDLQPDRFRWRAEVSRDEGARWHKAIEMLAQRVRKQVST